jgi:hypothetical protein
VTLVAQPTPAQLAAAAGGRLPVVSADQLPPTATFWFWTSGAPFPSDLWPDMTCYDLGDGSYLLDDRGYPYTTLQDCGPLDPGPGGSDIGGCSCELYLTIQPTGSNTVVLTLHRGIEGRTYTIWSTTNLALPLTNWIRETNLVAASGGLTSALIPMDARSNLFFRASGSSLAVTNYAADTNSTFTGMGSSDTQFSPPDTMGAMGPSHFVELLNGYDDNTIASISAYDRAGHLVAITNSAYFFRMTNGGTVYPLGGVAEDPRILYDRQQQRWVASVLDSYTIVIAVSKSDDPTDFVNGWYRYAIPLGRGSDFDTMGVYGNGIYLSVLHSYDATNSANTIVAIKKPEIYYGTNLISTNFFITNGPPVPSIQPVVNFDGVAADGYAWFVAKGAPSPGPDYLGGGLWYRWLPVAAMGGHERLARDKLVCRYKQHHTLPKLFRP